MAGGKINPKPMGALCWLPLILTLATVTVGTTGAPPANAEDVDVEQMLRTLEDDIEKLDEMRDYYDSQKGRGKAGRSSSVFGERMNSRSAFRARLIYC